MKIDQVKRILALGAGTMGHQIGFLCAVHGFEVRIYDKAPDMLDRARGRVDRLVRGFIKNGRIDAEDAPAILNRISYTDDAVSAAVDVDIVTESVPEDPELKGEVFSTFNRLCPQRTVFTTNTSTLVPSMFAEATGRPDRFLAFHFHDILLTDVVDVMPHPGTSADSVALIRAFAERLQQTVIVLERENFGYVFNAMLSDLFKSALTLASNRVAAVEDIDRAWMGVLQAPMGPFGMMDSVGVDTVWKVTDYWARATREPQGEANAAFLKRRVDQGRLGAKCGAGFYDYPSPAFRQPGFLKQKTGK
ncbi:3-hydroxybutyryl-CoA dehydrogenase [Desulfosarcina alkanivorans]|uniref:3-hydroxybutyryl-CoA dehydrogenase n=1 Tax=Desulfosarcina alkanivorans TaxID=571177 RepID=A0A5K7YIH2_9BACT|nr:3-hydroxyacyl-CoA dehydrogenase [Desulfosarcina alkanivorans]BBO67890.1 3-hydroxybutyryl-CoA dehydrogenase [Desulfosarcina alkanivorans]